MDANGQTVTRCEIKRPILSMVCITRNCHRTFATEISTATQITKRVVTLQSCARLVQHQTVYSWS